MQFLPWWVDIPFVSSSMITTNLNGQCEGSYFCMSLMPCYSGYAILPFAIRRCIFVFSNNVSLSIIHYFDQQILLLCIWPVFGQTCGVMFSISSVFGFYINLKFVRFRWRYNTGYYSITSHTPVLLYQH